MCCYLFGVLRIPDNVQNKDMMGMKRFYLYEGMGRLTRVPDALAGKTPWTSP